MDRHPFAAATRLLLFGLPVHTIAALPGIELPVDGDELAYLRAEAAGSL